MANWNRSSIRKSINGDPKPRSGPALEQQTPPNIKWTPKMVADQIEESATTMRRLVVAGLRPREYGNSWPTVVHDAMEAYGWNEVLVRLGPPPAEAITRMDRVLSWLSWLDVDQVRLVWLHAERVPRKVITASLGISRATAWRFWMAALMIIVNRLNSAQAASLKHDVSTTC